MSVCSRQTGVALFTAVFLIAAVGVLAISIAVIAGQQQLASAQSLEQTQAYYTARARLDREIAQVLSGGGCGSTPGTQSGDVKGFTTELLVCDKTTPSIDEGGDTYDVYTLNVEAHRGNRQAGTYVRRVIETQVTTAN